MVAVVKLDWWRNFKPVVPEVIEISGYVGRRIIIDLKPYLLQGARDSKGSPTDGVLDKVDVQRGWLCSALVVSQPQSGIARLSDDKTSIVYVPNATFLGEDCFNVRLTNGTQASDPMQIRVSVQDYYRCGFSIQQRANDVYDFTENHNFKIQGQRVPYCYSIHWYYKRPVAIFNTVRQANEVFEREDVVQESLIVPPNSTTIMPTIVLRSKLSLACPMDNLSGFNGSSNMIYKPQRTRGSLRMVLRLYLTVTYIPYPWDKSYVDTKIYTEIEYETPAKWWLSGAIKV